MSELALPAGELQRLIPNRSTRWTRATAKSIFTLAYLLRYPPCMATKMELMKMLQESRGYEEITNRRPTPRPIVLYLMQLRAHAQPQPPRSRLTITAEWSENAHTPLPVKINHIEPGGCDLPIVFG